MEIPCRNKIIVSYRAFEEVGGREGRLGACPSCETFIFRRAEMQSLTFPREQFHKSKHRKLLSILVSYDCRFIEVTSSQRQRRLPVRQANSELNYTVDLYMLMYVKNLPGTTKSPRS